MQANAGADIIGYGKIKMEKLGNLLQLENYQSFPLGGLWYCIKDTVENLGRDLNDQMESRNL